MPPLMVRRAQLPLVEQPPLRLDAEQLLVAEAPFLLTK